MPSDTQYLPLSELVELRTERVVGQKDPNLPYVGLEHIAQGEPLLLGTAPSSSSISTNSVFEARDILFGKLRPNLRKSLQVEFRGYCSTDILVLRARQEVHPGFAAKVLQSVAVFDAAVQTAIGTKMPRTSWEHLKTLSVFAPRLAEQRRISEILDAADEAIQQTEQVITKLKAVKAGLLHDLLTRGLDEHGRLRDPQAHPEQFKDSPLGRVPRQWEISSVESEFEIATGFTLGPHRYPRKNKRPYLRVANVLREEILLDDIVELEASEGEMTGRVLQENDLLVVEGHANPGEIGRCARVPREAEGLTFQNHLFRLRSSRLNTRFALAWLNGLWVRDHWRRMCRTSSGLNTINSTMLRSLPVPVPVRQEQRCIAAVFDIHDTRIRAEETALANLRQVKRGLMDDLLTGRVRVGG